MRNNILLWKTIGAEQGNFVSLLTKKYFYWSKDSKFSSLDVGDYIYIVDKNSATFLFATFAGDKGLKVENDELLNKTIVLDSENQEIVEAKGSRWKDFIKFKIVQQIDITSQDWLSRFKYQSTNGTMYLYKYNPNIKTGENKFVPSKTVKSCTLQKMLLELELIPEARELIQKSIAFVSDNNDVKIKEKTGFYVILDKFLKQSKTKSQVTRDYPKNFKNTEVSVSFGKGNIAKIPWIAFLKEPNKVPDGIYPVYLYFKSSDILILSFGLSESNNPSIKWDLIEPETIKNYFLINGLENPERYGSSYVYKVYDIKSLPEDNVLNTDLDNILNIYDQQTNINIPVKVKLTNKAMINQVEFNLSKLINDINSSGLIYSDQLITRYISSLTTKPFVLLSGLSGSGKTKLAQSFAQWICEDKTQYCIVPVGADWTNREPLLGYENALSSVEYIKPENRALQLLINANNNIDKPHFLILDEMNLSHVERYFADFLSIMETNEKFKLHSDKENEKSGVPHELDWPKNLFVVGTVNIDETTYMFSPKVLDRANAIEFRVDETEIEEFLDTPNEIDLTQLVSKGANMGASFIKIARNKEFETIDTNALNKTLVNFFVELKKTGAEFGYRTGMEIHRLYLQLSVISKEVTENDKIDIAVMQKLLPKLHGSRRKLCPILETLANLCVKGGDVKKDFLDNKEHLIFKENVDVIYPLSLEKITRMYKGAIDNGFASYAEA